VNMTKLKVQAPLDPGFSPLPLALRAFRRDVKRHGAPAPLTLVFHRSETLWSTYRMDIFPEGVDDPRNFSMVDRVAKSLLWMRGGHRVSVSGSPSVFEYLKGAYRTGGSRAFDADFMQTVYERPFEVCWLDEAGRYARSAEDASDVGRHLNGCRIGFDAGGSDRKVSAVIDGEAVYSEEVVWFPKTQEDPEYHYQGILSALRAAAARLPRVDAIGVSSAGVFVDNRVMAASLFIKVPRELFNKKVKDIYINAAREMGGVPLVVANDGDVTALAGAMSLETGRVLGLAMGTSQAGGYVDSHMRIMGWLNELAFVPVDGNPAAMADEWSGDIGCGVKYFSQDAVIKLAPAAGIVLNAADSPADRLKAVQKEMEEGNPQARKIYETIGVYLAHAVAWYAEFYDVAQVLVMGRVTSGEGGTVMIDTARETMAMEYPELAGAIALSIPDERARRVGQSVAAASLPEVRY